MNKSVLLFITLFSLMPVASAEADSLPAPYQQISLSNGTTVKYTPGDATFQVTDSQGHTESFRSGQYRPLLTATPYGAHLSAQDVSKAAAFAIDAPSAKAKTTAPVQMGFSIQMNRQQAAQLDQVMAKKSGLSADELSKLINGAIEHGKHVYYIDKQGRKELVRDRNANSGPREHDLAMYAFAGASARKGSRTEGMGVMLDDKFALEASCSAEGKQPDHIPNRNVICNYDVVAFFPFTNRFRAFVGAGVTEQDGTQKGAKVYTNHEDFTHGANVEYGLDYDILKNFSIEIREETADYPQLYTDQYKQYGNPNNEIEGNPIGKPLLAFIGVKLKVPLGQRHASQSQASAD